MHAKSDVFPVSLKYAGYGISGWPGLVIWTGVSGLGATPGWAKRSKTESPYKESAIEVRKDALRLVI